MNHEEFMKRTGQSKLPYLDDSGALIIHYHSADDESVCLCGYDHIVVVDGRAEMSEKTAPLSAVHVEPVVSAMARFHYGDDGVSVADRDILLRHGYIEPAGEPGYWAETKSGRALLAL